MQAKTNVVRGLAHAHLVWTKDIPATLPGLLLTFTIAATAFVLRHVPGLAGFSPMILAVLIGILVRNTVGYPAAAQPGIAISIRRVLRFAIVLLGMQLTVSQVMALGINGALIVTASLSATFAFTVVMASAIGVDRKLAFLIGAGTSVCGASAVVATNAVAGAQQDDVTYAIASVTVLGTVAMFVYPPLATMMALNPHDYGLWTGASIHEIAQVVAASFQYGHYAGEFGTLAKLSRVILLAPLVLSLGFFVMRSSGPGRPTAHPPVPWFVFGFLAIIGINSLLDLSENLRASLMVCTSFLLSVALAAMGLETQINRIRAKGLRPFLLAMSATLFISMFSLLLITVLS